MKIVLGTLFILCLAIFGFSQYVAVSLIEASITHKEMISKNEMGSSYSIELKFENPSFLALTSETTKFAVVSNNEKIGSGQLESFMLKPTDTSFAKGMFHTNSNSDLKFESIEIVGITKFDLFVASIEIPFSYSPTEEQAREFIHQE